MNTYITEGNSGSLKLYANFERWKHKLGSSGSFKPVVNFERWKHKKGTFGSFPSIHVDFFGDRKKYKIDPPLYWVINSTLNNEEW